MLLSGTKISNKIYGELREKISKLKEKPCLGILLVGNNPASLRYIKQKKKHAEEIGMTHKLIQTAENISQKELISKIQKLNEDKNISAYIVQLPLPEHINEDAVIEAIDPAKDADGFHPINQGKVMIGDTSGFTPCTPAGVMEIFRQHDISLSGKNVCILGRSNIVGKPLAVLCINAGATVSSCNSRTPDISLYTKKADIVICATGQKHILTADMISPKAVVIDVGFSIENDKIYGDADTQKIVEQGNPITPVPGGVGPMTVAMLLSNTLKAYEKNR